MNLKDKAMDVVGETLKNAFGGEKLCAHTDAAEKLSRTVKEEAENLLSNSVDHTMSRKRSKQMLSNRDVMHSASQDKTGRMSWR